MNWTTTPPTEPGYYFVFNEAVSICEVRRVRGHLAIFFTTCVVPFDMSQVDYWGDKIEFPTIGPHGRIRE